MNHQIELSNSKSVNEGIFLSILKKNRLIHADTTILHLSGGETLRICWPKWETWCEIEDNYIYVITILNNDIFTNDIHRSEFKLAQYIEACEFLGDLLINFINNI